MSIRKHILASCAVIALVPAISTAASAKPFKAKYYKECYADVKDVAKLVKPKESMQKKAKKASGLFGAIGSVAGLGGLGGSAVKAYNTAEKINKYSGMIDNISAFSEQMNTDYPDANDRFAAYSNHMSEDAANLVKVQNAISASQDCYNNAYDTVVAEQEAGTLKKRKAKKRLKEIRKGTIATGDVLIDAMNHINKNLGSYNSVLGGEEQALSTGMGGYASSFFARHGSSVATGLVAANAGSAAGAARYMQASGSQAAVKASLISNLAGLANMDGQESVDPGVHAIAQSSEEYLTLHQSYLGTVEAQRQLELKLAKK